MHAWVHTQQTNVNLFLALNSAEAVAYTHAVSFQIHTREQSETGRAGATFLASGGIDRQIAMIQEKSLIPPLRRHSVPLIKCQFLDCRSQT